ncbi:MAG: 16S rRNA (cytosine(967)-C(5))-methyltransferase RsmB [Caldicoprobacterales bacterium]|jgi:16S rRNA (cytosine967-C5)-methyltransferase
MHHTRLESKEGKNIKRKLTNTRNLNAQGVSIARELALKVLYEVNHEARYANISLKENLRRNLLTNQDVAFVTRLVYGTLEKQFTIDEILEKLANMKRIKPWLRNILRMGAYQILFLDRVPDSAACNEAVKLCKLHGLYPFSGFVNGVLRNLSRKKKELLSLTVDMPIQERLAFQYSYPLWLADKWINDYGIEKAEAIMKPIQDDEGITIRVNTIKISPEILKDKLVKDGFRVRDGYYMREALKITGGGDIEKLTLYRHGFFTVQGESSMLVVSVLDPQPNESILDACSAPGGKATYMAEKMLRKGRICALDIHPHRVELIKMNSKRMDSEIIESYVFDASKYNQEWHQCFDRVLVDAPCSGLGTLYKKPDIKARLTLKCYKELTILQMKILQNCSYYVKPGGVLVYSTCTINVEENQNIINEFLKKNPDYELQDPAPYIPYSLRNSIQNNMIQLIPSRHLTDGFFIARMRRNKDVV